MIRCCILIAILLSLAAQDMSAREPDSSDVIIEPFPILAYDTDIGFGYGIKVVFRNQLGMRESFDVTAFNSTKGERWYRLAASFPDGELRHGTTFPFSLDLVVDYDKWISNSFYGIGIGSRFGDRESYTKEPFEASLTVGRGFSSVLVGQLGVRFRAIRNSGFDPSGRMQYLPDADGRASYMSVFGVLRYDSRNNTVHPSTGIVLQADYEFAPDVTPGDASLSRSGATAQGYIPVFTDDLILAGRVAMAGVDGGHIPQHFLLSVGGNGTLRGSTQDRYLDRVVGVVNGELRFPIYRRFAGVAGFDLGSVWPSLKMMRLAGWSMNPTAGLRFIMETFVVRLDVGFGKETTGVYFNFGQLF
jgi:outer membrane protein assembly factor BamA